MESEKHHRYLQWFTLLTTPEKEREHNCKYSVWKKNFLSVWGALLYFVSISKIGAQLGEKVNNKGKSMKIKEYLRINVEENSRFVSMYNGRDRFFDD